VWFSSPISEIEAAVAALEAAYDGPTSAFEADPKRPLSLLITIMQEYAKEFPREADPFEVLATEEYTKALMVRDHWSNDFNYCGIQDLLINLNDNILIVDHKTTGSYLNQLYFDQFTLDVQMRGYVALQLALGKRCDGVYINAIQIDTKYHKVKPDKHFVRYGPILFEQEQIDEWARDVERDLRRIEKYEAEGGRWPQFHSGCTVYFKRCSFFDVCRMPKTLADKTLEVEFKRERWNPKEVAAKRQEAKG